MSVVEPKEPSAKRRTVSLDSAVAEPYFASYGDLSVHCLMLHDAPRVGAYAAALRVHARRLRDRAVLDVGTGSGVLAMLAARAGARRVYAVEASPNVAALARQAVARNGLGDVVQVLEARVEELELPEQVDAIVSEWMGFYLVHESMLPSVLHARDRWLKKGGLMLPGSARIFAALVEAEDFRREVEGLEDVCSLDLSLLREASLERRSREPQVEDVEPQRLLTAAALVADWDLGRLRAEETWSFEAALQFVALRPGHAAAVACWFDTGFGAGVTLATGPGVPRTHWRQTVVYLGSFVKVEPGDPLPLRVLFSQSEQNPRQYNISIETE